MLEKLKTDNVQKNSHIPSSPPTAEVKNAWALLPHPHTFPGIVFRHRGAFTLHVVYVITCIFT
jgi:hypothetical protein